MKILLHGAINGSNYGDCLFAKLFYDRLRQEFPDSEIRFFDIKPFGISEHLRDYLSYEKKLSLRQYKQIDALVYISGGYFGEGKKTLIGSLIRIARYFLLGYYYLAKGKPVFVIGVEVGPFHSSVVEKMANRILKSSKLCTVRNNESFQWCQQNGIDSILTADTAISARADMFDDELIRFQDERKRHIFLHVAVVEDFDDFFLKNVVIPILRFIENHTEYDVVYGCDGLVHHIEHERIRSLAESMHAHVQYFEYTNPSKLCALLNQCDVIVTRKLHVGILGATFSKSVISMPTHPYKTKRFFEQIGYPERCVSYNSMKSNVMADLLNSYHSLPIIVSDEIKKRSGENLNLLITSLQTE